MMTGFYAEDQRLTDTCFINLKIKWTLRSSGILKCRVRRSYRTLLIVVSFYSLLLTQLVVVLGITIKTRYTGKKNSQKKRELGFLPYFFPCFLYLRLTSLESRDQFRTMRSPPKIVRGKKRKKKIENCITRLGTKIEAAFEFANEM